MIPFVLLFTVVLLGLVEAASRRQDLRQLQVHFTLDSSLVEPGEVVTLRYTVRNASPLPLLYGGLTLWLDEGLTLREDEAFERRFVDRDYAGTRVNHHFYLAPRRQFAGRLRLSVNKRGVYALGKYYVEAGDFLGLRPSLRSGEMGLRIICTAARCDIPRLRVLGGDMGPVSVRRFIREDPTLVLGYRDYTGHEPLKQISWNQSAKAGRLIVRQSDYTVDRTATLLVHMDGSRPALMEKCLALTGSVCCLLENQKIPYALDSDGDLFSLQSGLGASHLAAIQKRIGLSRLTGYTGFQTLVDRFLSHRRPSDTLIVLAPALDAQSRAALGRLERSVDRKPIILCAEEEQP